MWEIVFYKCKELQQALVLCIFERRQRQDSIFTIWTTSVGDPNKTPPPPDGSLDNRLWGVQLQLLQTHWSVQSTNVVQPSQEQRTMCEVLRACSQTFDSFFWWWGRRGGHTVLNLFLDVVTQSSLDMLVGSFRKYDDSQGAVILRWISFVRRNKLLDSPWTTGRRDVMWWSDTSLAVPFSLFVEGDVCPPDIWTANVAPRYRLSGTASDVVSDLKARYKQNTSNIDCGIVSVQRFDIWLWACRIERVCDDWSRESVCGLGLFTVKMTRKAWKDDIRVRLNRHDEEGSSWRQGWEGDCLNSSRILTTSEYDFRKKQEAHQGLAHNEQDAKSNWSSVRWQLRAVWHGIENRESCDEVEAVVFSTVDN